jgi:SAM-dependent methyltransferase
LGENATQAKAAQPGAEIGLGERLRRWWWLNKKRRKIARQARRERRAGVNDEGYPVPPPLLRYRVHGRLNLESFLQSGRDLTGDVTRLLAGQGRKIGDFHDVLDFGCGCGRVLRYLGPQAPDTRFYGCDIDEDAIRWCQGNFADLGAWTVNPDSPPTDYPDAKFDLIVAVSVFTHLDEAFQFAWLDELKRISEPGGLLLLSVHGRESWLNLSDAEMDDLQSRGIVLQRAYNRYLELSDLPAFYHNTFHTREYLDREWGKRFRILDFVEGGIGVQDVLVLRND